jgi:hypothetical protein
MTIEDGLGIVGNDWDEPIPLPGSRDTAPFCAALLGDVAGNFVEAVATETATPPDLAGLAVLGVSSTLIAGSVVIEAHEGWQEPANLYLNGLAASGEGKSPVLAKVVAALDLVERERRAAKLPEITQARSLKRTAEARRKRLEEAAARADKELDKAAEAAVAAAQDAEKIVVPVPPRLYTRNATPEGLVRLLYEQDGRVAVISDEAADFYEMAARYSSTGRANFDIYIAGWDGRRYISDRAGRDAVDIEHTTMTVCILGQRALLADLGKDRQVRDRGVLARSLWALPPTKVGRRPIHRQPVPADVTQDWEDLVISLANQAVNTSRSRHVLRLEAAAKQLFDEWQTKHEPRLLAEVGDLASIPDWGSKLPGQVLRLAGNLHALRTVRLDGTISGETMQAAVDLADYCIDHAIVVFAKIGVDDAMEDALQVLRWLEERGLRETTTREVYTSKDWKGVRARVALSVLADLGWIRQVPRPDGPGRFAERWLVHPKLRRTTAHHHSGEPIVRHCAPEGDVNGLAKPPKVADEQAGSHLSDNSGDLTTALPDTNGRTSPN